VRRSGWIVLTLVLALAVCGVGAAAALTQQAEVREPVVVAAGDFAVRGTGDAAELVPVHRFYAAEALVPQLLAYSEPHPPADAAPIATLRNPTYEVHALVVGILDESDDGEWLYVRLPQRPNGLTGWVRAADVRQWSIPNRVEVTLSTNMLRIYDGDSDVVLFETNVATGRPNTPTPTGDFYIDIVNPLGGHPVYGWGQLSVSGFSNVLERFAGGIGQIAIHGWNDDSVMGTAASNGCVRMRNGDVARVAELAPLGTPVRILP
jgi:hypothetical protein